LRVAEGQVRCGRCQLQFDALERLVDEGTSTTPETGATPRSSEPELQRESEFIEVEEPAAHEEITLEGRHIEITGTYLVVDPDAENREPHLRHEVVEEWVEIGDDETLSYDEQERELPAADAAIAAEQEEPIEVENEPESTAVVDEPAMPAHSGDVDMFTRPRRQPTALVWKILVVPLFLLLVAQVVHHYRAELARHPRVGETVMSAYAALGIPLTPDWNLHAYEIRHWAVVPDVATGTLTLRASITNRERFAQPYPLLKLVLEDRWGDTVREREFEPAEYLDSGTVTDRLLPPAGRANVDIAIVDPGAEAAGFRFEACLRGRSAVVCAGEVPR
jgi:hypothetical protein